ncbi:MAG TPA: AMP-binding protein [Vicinamibacteria bacterium]|nr:AMP-binding protein [Vicinamibacteria bacterium]
MPTVRVANTMQAPAPTETGASEALPRILEILRGLAFELHGARAERAVTPEASLERDLGLGSLERVELLSRLEAAFGRSLGDRFLSHDTAAELAAAVGAEAVAADAGPADRAAARLGAAAQVAAAPTLHETLWRRAAAEPERVQAWVREDDGREQAVTYGRLLEAARALAGGLRERGVRRGDTVALMLPTGFDFLRSFQGILIAGAIPVPIYPPARLDRLEEYARRQSAILADAGVKLMITVGRAMPIAALLRPSVPSLGHVATAEELDQQGEPWAAPEGGAEDPAFIQYTSGSTGHPKGVLLTHANLLANIRAIRAGLQAVPTDVGASWLPLYHDMGLIGSWLFCLVDGLPIALLSPLAFLARPERWLWTIHERRATLSAAPNFAYELCVRRIPDSALEGLDLSSWRCALNGAEPVNPDTLERFARRFAPCGFRREAMMPVYGLAENSVALCFPPPGRGPRIDRVARRAFADLAQALPAADDESSPLRFVSVGRPLPEHDVRLVDDAGADVAERHVGRLLFRGPSMTPGYFRQPEATAAMSASGGFYDSGDLAYAADGEIYITGRRKDLIIKGGRNLVPQEIEELASGVAGIRRGCVVAFGRFNEATATESLIVVAETRITDEARRDALVAAVGEQIAEGTGVPPDQVVLVPPGAVPKTSSGKIRRAATKELHEKGQLGRASRPSLWVRLRLYASAALAEGRGPLRAAGRALYAAWLALSLGLGLLIAWPVAFLIPGRRAATLLERILCGLALRLVGCRLSSDGLDRLPANGPLLLASNHASYSDVPALLALLPRPFLFVAKKEVLRWPFIGMFVKRAGHLTVDRFDAQQGVADASRVATALEAGCSVLVFPEGTFTGAAGLRPFRLGAFKTAVETGTPIVPLALTGTRRVLRDGAWLPRPGRVHLWVGAPIAAEGSDWKAIVALRDRVAEEIAAHCGEPRLDLVAGGPPRRE